MQIGLDTARRLALYSQRLAGNQPLAQDSERTMQLIEHLGYVQIDTISVVERAHHHVLWTRDATYCPPRLHQLHAQERRVFEYWAHAAAYIPINDYRYYLPRMRAYAARPQTREWLERNAMLVEHVLERIRAEGALSSAEFAAPEGFQRGTWWSRKPAKQALEVLFTMGTLMIAARRNFQRVYDLKERFLPPDLDTSEPDRDELARYMVRRALAAQGVASVKEIQWQSRQTPHLVAGAIEELVATGEVTLVEIAGDEDSSAYALTALLEGPAALAPDVPLLHILSPFDNLIIQRQRLKRLFGLDYSLECYLPATKRRFGYFTLPILWGERFVGHMDSKADRHRKTLVVRALLLSESGTTATQTPADDGLLPALAAKLWAFACFNGCERIEVEHSDPAPVREALLAALAREEGA